MSLLSGILESFLGKTHFFVTIGDKKVLEISVIGREILVEVKNLPLAIEFGLMELIKAKGPKSGTGLREMVKGAGYKIKVKYGPMKFSL